MIHKTIAAIFVAALFIVPTAAQAKHRHHHYRHRYIHMASRATGNAAGCLYDNAGRVTCTDAVEPLYARPIENHSPAPRKNSIRSRGLTYSLDAHGNRSDPRPGAWCGWWMRHYKGVADRAYNLARNWAHYGSNAGGPRVGAIVVWSHHVGVITGGGPGHWIVKSGNDGHAVRERERSLRGAIAFRA